MSSLIARSLACGLLAASVVTFGPGTASNAANTITFSPTIVARAGSSNVLYVLWESNSCTLRNCLRLERSTNGGGTFTNASVPPVTPVLGMNTSPISQLYFSNPMDGYAVEFASTGPKWTTAALFATFNGGRTWHHDQIMPNSYVYSMATSDHYVYALSDQCPTKGPKCEQVRLSRSPVSASRWSPVPLPRQLERYWLGNLDVAAYGQDVWLSTQDQMSNPYSAFLATSHDQGRSFTVRVQRDLTSAASCGVLPTSALVLWAQCPQGMMRGDIVYSENGGESWIANGFGQLSNFAFGAFDPVSKGAAFFVNQWHPRTLFEVASESSPPRAVGSMPNANDWISLEFTNGAEGVALNQGTGGSYPNLLWRTGDRGTHWSRVRLL